MGSRKIEIMSKALQVVSEVTFTEVADLLGPSKRRDLADARKMFSYVIVNQSLFRLTCTEIGMFMRRDHATILYSHKEAETLRKHDKTFNRMLTQVEERLQVYGVFMKADQFASIAQL